MSRRPTLPRFTWRRLARETRGVSAVEFALLAPILILLYTGLAEFCQGFMAVKRAEHTASTVADLVSQVESINDDGVDDVFAAGELIMAPFPTNTLEQRVSGVTADKNGVAKVVWSDGDGLPALQAGVTVTPPAGMIAANESLVMAEVRYVYNSPVGHVLPAATVFQKTYYLRPRRSDSVLRE